MAVNGIEPSSQNFQNRKYPFVSEVFIAWVDELPKGGMAEVVRDWILSEAGQQLVEESGYTPIR
jgi:phosphate transport system substrate-binding protein